MKCVIDMAADRGAFIDQSQSFNVFMRTPTPRKTLVDALLRLEEGPQDRHVLPALGAPRTRSSSPSTSLSAASEMYTL